MKFPGMRVKPRIHVCTDISHRLGKYVQLCCIVKFNMLKIVNITPKHTDLNTDINICIRNYLIFNLFGY